MTALKEAAAVYTRQLNQ